MQLHAPLNSLECVAIDEIETSLSHGGHWLPFRGQVVPYPTPYDTTSFFLIRRLWVHNAAKLEFIVGSSNKNCIPGYIKLQRIKPQAKQLR